MCIRDSVHSAGAPPFFLRFLHMDSPFARTIKGEGAHSMRKTGYMKSADVYKRQIVTTSIKLCAMVAHVTSMSPSAAPP